MKLTGTNDQLMAMAAHRYCIGRSSYIPGSCMEWIRATWAEFEPNTQNVMLRDTVEELVRWPDMAYADEWMDTALWMYERVTDEQKSWLHDAVSHIADAITFLKPNAEVKRRGREADTSA
jgi:hypothetical protein